MKTKTLSAIAIIALATAFGTARADTPHTFTLDTSAWQIKPKSVTLAGDFNKFNPNTQPLTHKGDHWQVVVNLTDGVHAYKFVIDRQRWIQDPKADPKLDVDDGNGGKNSGVGVGPGYEAEEAAKVDGQTEAPKPAGHVFSLDVSSWQMKPKTLTVAGDFNGFSKTANPLTAKGDVWSTAVKMPDGVHHYKFVADGERWLQDPKADPKLDAEDGNGGKNSGVTVNAAADAAAGGDDADKPADKAEAKAAAPTFSIDVSSWQIKPKTLHVAGDFNGFSTTALPMTAKGDVWSADAKLTPGVHHYKFVADGERWLQDPKADTSLDADDGNGGKNSGVNIGPAGDVISGGHAAADGKASAQAGGFAFALDTSAWQDKPRSVNLAGEFNGWNKDALLMHQSGDVWTINVPLPEGPHAYKFVVDGDRWIPDPKADASLESDDGNGGKNSGVLVGPDARKLPAPKPNAINTAAILFDPNSPADRNVESETSLRLRLRVQDGDAEHVYATSPAMGRIELHKLGAQLGYATYGGTLTVPPTAAGKSLEYGFELTDGTADVKWTGQKAEAAPLTVDLKPTFVTPDWAKHAVWYQIFPERFANGDPGNDPSNDEGSHFVQWTSDWWKVAPGETADNGHFAYDGRNTVFDRRYGGDVQGIKQSLPYLKKLGVTAIYLNPVFEAASMHKYDATDYRHIDNHFGVKGDYPVAGETEDPATWKFNGSDKVFLDFVAEAHAQGFKVVVDGVFNHVGRPNPFFQDVLEKGRNSKYADWFEITDFGDPKNWHKLDNPYAVHGHPGGIQWNAWDGKNGFLPNWKKDGVTGIVHGPLEYINGITKRWLAPDGDPSRGVDGWRLDAAEQVPHPFWVQWRQVVKEAKPDAYITGEIWNPAQAWINDGKQFDAVMNYQFAQPTVAFFADVRKPMSPSAFATKLGSIVYMYPGQASLAMMNLFDSHDTDRVASMFVNPDRAYDAGDRLQDPDGKNYSARKPNAEERQKQMQAVALQMAFLGSPMVYYGDEAGMWSPDDPSDREPMTWPGMKFDDPQVGFDQGVFDAYQRLIAVRATLPQLQTGDYWPVTADDNDQTLLIARGDPKGDAKGTAYVAFNRSPSPKMVKLPAGADVYDYTQSATLSPQDRPTVTLPASAKPVTAVELPAYGYAILAPRQ